MANMCELIDRLFKSAGHKYLSIGRVAYYHSDEKRNSIKFTASDVKELLAYVIENSFVVFAGKLFHQRKGLPMGSPSAPIIADLVLSNLEFRFLTEKRNRSIAERLKFTMRYVDDILSLGSEALREAAPLIYPDSLPLNFDDTSSGVGHFLDLNINTHSGQYTVFDKRREFPFEVIRFPEKSSNQPLQSGLKVYFGQLLRMAERTNSREEFAKNAAFVTETMMTRGFTLKEVEDTARKVFARYPLAFRRSDVTTESSLLELIKP